MTTDIRIMPRSSAASRANAQKIGGEHADPKSGVTTHTVELKTAAPGVTRTAQIQTGFDTVEDYAKYLQGRYSYMNTGTTSMQGVPTTVTVSSAFLRKCKDDPEKAAYLEENLAALPGCAKMAVNGCLGTLTSLSYSIDGSGNITCISSGTNDPDGKIARENARRKAQEKKTAAEKAEKKRAEAQEKEKRAEAKRAERSATRAVEKNAAAYTARAAGADLRVVTEKIIALSRGERVAEQFDLKA